MHYMIYIYIYIIYIYILYDIVYDIYLSEQRQTLLFDIDDKWRQMVTKELRVKFKTLFMKRCFCVNFFSAQQRLII